MGSSDTWSDHSGQTSKYSCVRNKNGSPGHLFIGQLLFELQKFGIENLVTWTSILCRLCSKGFFLTLKLRYYKYSSLSSPIEPVSSKRDTFVCAPIEDSDQPAHLYSLIRVFYVRSMGSIGSNISSDRKLRL